MSTSAVPTNSDAPLETMPAAHALAERAFDLLAVVQLPDFRFRALNPGGRRLLRCAPKARIVDLLWADFVIPETWQLFQTQLLPALQQGRSWHGRGRLRTSNGTEIPVQLFVTSQPAAPDECGLVLIAAQDDSRFQNLQSALRHEQLLLHALFDTLPDAIYFKDRESRFIRINAAMAERMSAGNYQDVLGRTDAEINSTEQAQQALADEKRIIATAEPMLDMETKETWPDGRITWVSTSKFPLRDWQGAIVGTYGISRDITTRKHAEKEQRRLEAQSHLSQKMESIGRLAAGVAHEINTPTQYITDNTHFLVGAFAQLARVIKGYRNLQAQAASHPDCEAAARDIALLEVETELDYLLDEIPRTFEQTIDGISRVARIGRSLREFSHPNAPDKQPANLNHAIATAIAISRHEWKLVAEVVTDLDPELPLVPCVLDEINQVLLNLIVNAAHAIAEALADRPGERGRITLRTRRDGAWALLDVADNGTGIAPEVQQRIFEPFFTTKPLGKGTGQGLALVHTVIVKNHEGSIDLTTEPGRGTTLHLRLPLHPDSTADASSSTAALAEVTVPSSSP
jgi:PAS domain S-box-containing protein